MTNPSESPLGSGTYCRRAGMRRGTGATMSAVGQARLGIRPHLKMVDNHDKDLQWRVTQADGESMS